MEKENAPTTDSLTCKAI